MFQTKSIYLQLVKLKVKATYKSARKEDVDGEIELTGGYHIQVGSSYLCLNHIQGEGDNLVMSSYPFRGKLLSLLKDIASNETLETPELIQYIESIENAPKN